MYHFNPLKGIGYREEQARHKALEPQGINIICYPKYQGQCFNLSLRSNLQPNWFLCENQAQKNLACFFKFHTVPAVLSVKFSSLQSVCLKSVQSVTLNRSYHAVLAIFLSGRIRDPIERCLQGVFQKNQKNSQDRNLWTQVWNLTHPRQSHII